MIGRADAVLRKQVVKNQGRGETAEMTALHLGVGLERETRVELATLCLGSTGLTLDRSQIPDLMRPMFGRICEFRMSPE